jgi:hypothetical protein
VNVDDFQSNLPLRIERTFRALSYQLSHSRLELRSGVGFDDRIHVTFVNVIGMQVKQWYGELVIAQATDTIHIDRFVNIPERFSRRYMRLTVGDGTSEGFVVCGALDVRRVASTGEASPYGR